jgi:hypothetical protein
LGVYLPERSRDTVGPGNVRRLEKSRSPSPLTDNNRGSQTGLDHSTSSAVGEKDSEEIIQERVSKVRKSREWKHLIIKFNNDFNLLEMFTGLVTPISKVFVDEDNARRENTEESSKSEHDEVSDTLGERRLASEHGFLPPVLVEGGQLDTNRRC